MARNSKTQDAANTVNGDKNAQEIPETPQQAETETGQSDSCADPKSNESGQDNPPADAESSAKTGGGEATEQQEQLESLDALAMSRRVPSWQHAAILRAMGWVDGKMVTGTEYDEALERVRHRRMGSGRMA